jgi:hypothetical protein
MRSLTLRRAAVAALVPLTLGSLAACGNSDSSDHAGTAADPGAGPSSPTSHASSSPVPGSKVTSADYLQLLKASMSKTTTVKVSMTGDVSGGSYTMKGAMDLTGDKPALDINMDMSTAGLSGVEARLVDGSMYVSMGSLTQGKFVKFDLSDPNSPLGSLGSTLDQLDPGKFVSRMNPGAFRHITYVGSDTYGRHFHATAVTAKSSTQLKGLPPSVMASLPKTMGYDTWLDAQGRLSRVAVSVPTYMKMTMTYSDYGVPVHIAAPPASQITALPGTSTTG